VRITAVPFDGDLTSALAREEVQVLIMDMRMPVSARQVARDAIRKRPDVAVFFWTEYVGDPEYEDLERSLNPLIRCAKGVKVPRADSDGEILESSLITPVRNLVRRPSSGALSASLGSSSAYGRSSRAFTLTVDEMMDLSIPAARGLVREAQELCRDEVHIVFQNSDAEWLLMAGPEMDIIRWGASRANLPDSRRIAELGRRHGHMPYLFRRPIESDEVTLGSTWCDCPPTDFYPCLGIDVLQGDSNVYQVHLDTGAPHTLLSYETLRESGAIDHAGSLDVRAGIREPNQPFEYLDQEVDLLLSDGSESQRVKVRPLIVFEWAHSPFSRRCPHGNCPGSRPAGGRFLCGRREAGLLGRDILVEGTLQVVLDGANQQTRFLRRGLEPDFPIPGRIVDY
jgi:CheY-like chemotaxis protein